MIQSNGEFTFLNEYSVLGPRTQNYTTCQLFVDTGKHTKVTAVLGVLESRIHKVRGTRYSLSRVQPDRPLGELENTFQSNPEPGGMQLRGCGYLLRSELALFSVDFSSMLSIIFCYLRKPLDITKRERDDFFHHAHVWPPSLACLPCWIYNSTWNYQSWIFSWQ